MALQRVYVKSSEFQPNDELILVKPEPFKAEEVTESGLVVSIRKETVVERPAYGTVLGIGAKVQDINIGDIIFWPSTDGIDLEFDDGVFLLLRDKSIIGKKK